MSQDTHGEMVNAQLAAVEAAAGGPTERRLFEINQAEVAGLFPCVESGAEALAAMMRAGNPAWDKDDNEAPPPIGQLSVAK